MLSFFASKVFSSSSNSTSGSSSNSNSSSNNVYYYSYICVKAYACKFRCPQRPKVSDFPGANITGSWELPNMGAGNQTPVLYKSSKSS